MNTSGILMIIILLLRIICEVLSMILRIKNASEAS